MNPGSTRTALVLHRYWGFHLIFGILLPKFSCVGPVVLHRCQCGSLSLSIYQLHLQDEFIMAIVLYATCRTLATYNTILIYAPLCPCETAACIIFAVSACRPLHLQAALLSCVSCSLAEPARPLPSSSNGSASTVDLWLVSACILGRPCCGRAGSSPYFEETSWLSRPR